MDVEAERVAAQSDPLSTPNPDFEDTTECAQCGSGDRLYSLGVGMICLGCIGAAVSMAANDLWPGGVSYSREFEAEVLM